MNITRIAGDLTDEEREMHYSIARLILQNQNLPPRVYSLGDSQTLLVTESRYAHVFVSGGRVFSARLGDGGAYRTYAYFNEKAASQHPGLGCESKHRYITQLNLTYDDDGKLRLTHPLKSDDEIALLKPITDHLNILYEDVLGFELSRQQRRILRDGLQRGFPFVLSRSQGPKLMRNWRETFEVLGSLQRDLALKTQETPFQIVSYPKSFSVEHQLVQLVTDDKSQPAVSLIRLAPPTYTEEYGIQQIIEFDYSHVPKSGSCIMVWRQNVLPTVLPVSAKIARLVRKYFSTIAQKPDAFVGNSALLREFRSALEFVYNENIPSYKTLAQFERACMSHAYHFVGLVVSASWCSDNQKSHLQAQDKPIEHGGHAT